MDIDDRNKRCRERLCNIDIVAVSYPFVDNDRIQGGDVSGSVHVTPCPDLISLVSDNKTIDFDSVESRRSSVSRRRMSPARRLLYFVGLPIARGVIRLLTSTYRFQPVIGEEHILPLINNATVSVPCYWHQNIILCSTYMREVARRGYKLCVLVSGSVDGEVPAKIARSWGAKVIRGSANQSGALALRDQHQMVKKGYSIVTLVDGPSGPKLEVKTGAILMARIANVPIIPIACAADRAWHMDTWDGFIIPKPFARVVVAIGEPYRIRPDDPLDNMETNRLIVQQKIMNVTRVCEDALQNNKP